MPETAVATSAPSTPAPAPAAGGGTPSWAGGDVGSWMAGALGSSAPAAPAAAAPAQPAPAPAAPPAQPEPSASPEATPAAPEPAPEAAQPAEAAEPPAPAPATPAQPARLYAERFKTVEELEAGYRDTWKQFLASGQEARRLAEQGQAAQAQVQKIQAELDAAKLAGELGPEIQDPTPEESANWDGQKWAKHESAKVQRANLKRQLEQDKKAKTEKEAADKERNAGVILGRMEQMAADPKRFPDFQALETSMSDIMDMAPGLVGNVNTPLIAYLAALGHRALQRDQAAQAAAGKAAEEAKKKAAAAAPAAAGPGGGAAPPPTEARPAGAGPIPGSDADHNARLIEAHTGRRPLLPID